MAPTPVPFNPPLTQAQFVGHMANWLRRNGFPIRDTQVMPDAELQARRALGNQGHYAFALPGVVAFDQAGPDVANVAARYGRRGRLNTRQLAGAQVALHELIHQMRYGRTPDFYTDTNSGPGWWEEAATEAAARDLMPNFTRELFGHRMPQVEQYAGSNYDDRTHYLRRLSAAAAPNAKGWRGIPARQWRRAFSHATPEQRDAMARAVQALIAKRAQAQSNPSAPPPIARGAQSRPPARGRR